MLRGAIARLLAALDSAPAGHASFDLHRQQSGGQEVRGFLEHPVDPSFRLDHAVAAALALETARLEERRQIGGRPRVVAELDEQRVRTEAFAQRFEVGLVPGSAAERPWELGEPPVELAGLAQRRDRLEQLAAGGRRGAALVGHGPVQLDDEAEPGRCLALHALERVTRRNPVVRRVDLDRREALGEDLEALASGH